MYVYEAYKRIDNQNQNLNIYQITVQDLIGFTRLRTQGEICIYAELENW